MHISGVKPYKVNGSNTVQMECPTCNRICEHYFVGAVVGPNLGFFCLPNKYHLGFRKYWLTCPNNNISKELTSAEASSLRNIL
jgi:hypothetical protein